MLKRLFLLLFVIAAAISHAAPSVKFTISSDKAELVPSEEFAIKATFEIPEGEHIYGKDVPEALGSPTKIRLHLPKGFKVLRETWPTTQKYEFMGESYSGYAKSAAIIFSIKAPPYSEGGEPLAIKADAEWLSCGELCVPGNGESEIKISIAPGGDKNADLATYGSPKSYGNIGFIIGAFIGGLILNLMPCVFPVIGLKIMSFASSASKGRAENIIGAIFYTAGILATFLALGGILVLLRGMGKEMGWGFQLQNPSFTGLMALLFFAMAISFLGAFEIGAGFAGKTASLTDKGRLKKHAGAFASGVIAVLVASPCTAPFMGSALGAALATGASATLTMGIFAALGLGMASPYLTLSAIPALSKLMPRPGNWMIVLQRILSIPLFATVAWLAWVYMNQTRHIQFLIGALIILSVGLRLFGKMTMPHREKSTRILGRLVCVVAITLSAIMVCLPNTAESEVSNDAWSKQRVESLLAEGKIVYVDFTADWCLTCAYNKRILDSEEIRDAFKSKNVAVLVGDWTNRNPEIARELEKFGRAGVPLNLVYFPKSPNTPKVLPAILTKSIILKAVEE